MVKSGDHSEITAKSSSVCEFGVKLTIDFFLGGGWGEGGRRGRGGIEEHNLVKTNNM